MELPVMRRVHRERVLLAGGGRALLMQLAHPAVAQGVADHSGFPRRALERLRRTLDLSLALVYGTDEEAERATAAIRGVHERVRGSVEGNAYRADDPRLLLWVNATLIDSTMVVYERFVRRLPEGVWRRYYQETKPAAVRLGIPEEVLPHDLASFRRYMRDVLGGGELRATPESRRLARGVLRPPLPPPYRPAMEVSRLVTLALLPLEVRRIFGLRAGPLARAALAGTAGAARLALPLLPDRLRTFTASRVYTRYADRG